MKFVNEAADMLCLAAAFAGGVLTRTYIDVTGDPLLSRFSPGDFVSLFAAFYAASVVSLRLTGVYPVRMGRRFEQMPALYARSVVFAVVAVQVGAHLLFLFNLKTSRLLLLSATFYSWIFFLLKERWIQALTRSMRANGRAKVRVLVVGEPTPEILGPDPGYSFEIVGWLSPCRSGQAGHLGGPEDLSRFLDSGGIDLVWFAEEFRGDRAIERALWDCEERGVEVWIRMPAFHRRVEYARIEMVAGRPFLSLRSGPEEELPLLVKEAIDRVGAVVLLAFSAPVMAVVALLVRLDSEGPALFVQERAGLNGRRFKFFKFRTMMDNADELRESLRALNQMKGAAFKMDRDPRVTRVGRWLRKTSLDELPQFWNVLRGEMSLVGPRPLPLDDVSRFDPWMRRRQSMKPGITGLWQVAGRSNIRDSAQWFRLDLRYIDEWSLWLDLDILLRTVPAVLFGRGAA
ncbi:MAG: sugar transferase [Elusimicrobia bacterium]|nr:sugar transferase [Elusimicrobiota bacterium]